MTKYTYVLAYVPKNNNSIHFYISDINCTINISSLLFHLRAKGLHLRQITMNMIKTKHL